MIDVPGIVEAILQSCPSFRQEAPALQEQWVADGRISLEPFLTDFADHLAQKLECEETDEFPQIFSLIEQVLRCSDRAIGRIIAHAFVPQLAIPHDGYTTNPGQLLAYIGSELQFLLAVASADDHVQDLLQSMQRLYPDFFNCDINHGKYYWSFANADSYLLNHDVILGDFSRYIVRLLNRGETERFPALFAVLEQYMAKHDSLSNAIAVSFYEHIQDASFCHNPNGPKLFYAYLGERSKATWNLCFYSGMV